MGVKLSRHWKRSPPLHDMQDNTVRQPFMQCLNTPLTLKKKKKRIT